MKLIVDPPTGETLATGRADVEFLPTEHVKRLREVLPLIPFQSPDDELTTWNGLASQGGKVCPGKTSDELWMLNGMTINEKKTVESVATELTNIFSQQQAQTNQQITEFTTQIGNLATAMQVQANAQNPSVSSSAPKRKVDKKR